MEFFTRSTGKIKTSAAINGSMFVGCDILTGTATATVTVYDSAANTGNILWVGTNTLATPHAETTELSYPVAGQGNLWIEIAGTQANCVVRYR